MHPFDASRSRLCDKLRITQRFVEFAPVVELFVRSRIDDFPGIHNDNSIGELDRAEAMGDDDCRSFFGEFAQRGLNLLFGLRVDLASCFVENEDRGVAIDRTRDRESLPLPAL